MKARSVACVCVVAAVLATGCERADTVDSEADAPAAEEAPWEDWQAPKVQQPDLTAAEAFRKADEEFSAALRDLSANGYPDPTRPSEWAQHDPATLKPVVRRLGTAYEALEDALAKEPKLQRMESVVGEIPMMWHSRLRGYGYAFALRNIWRQHEGQFAAAAEDGVRCVRIGTVLMSGASSMSVLSGLAVDWYAIHIFRDVAPHLSPESGRENLRAIRTAVEGRPTFAEMMQHERTMWLRGLRSVLSEDSSENLAEGWDEIDLEPEDINRAETWRQVVENWQTVVAQARKPYWEREAVEPPEDLLARQYTITGSVFGGAWLQAGQRTGGPAAGDASSRDPGVSK